MVRLYDSLGNFVRSFKDYKDAVVYKHTFGNAGWYIIY